MFCSKCGNQLSDEAKFCPNCGEKILTAAPADEVKTEEQTVETTEKENETVVEEKASEEVKEEAFEPKAKRKIFDSNDTPKTVIQLVAVVFGVMFFFIFCKNFFGGVFGAVGNIFSLKIFRLIANVLKAGTGAAAGGIAILFAVMVVRWEKEKADDFLISLASLGIFGVIVKLVACILSTILKTQYVNPWRGFSELVGLVVVSVAVMFGLFKAFGVSVFENLDTANIKDVVTESLLNVYNDATEEAANLKAHADAKKEAKAQFNAEQAANGGSTTTRVFVPLDTNRGLLKLILLNIVTCGIYSYIFIYKLAEDVNVACDGDGDHTPGLVALIVLSLVTCGIYGFVWYYKLGNRLQVNARRYGMEFPENGTTVLLWMLLGSFLCGFGALFATHIIIKNTNLICTAYNNYNAQA